VAGSRPGSAASTPPGRAAGQARLTRRDRIAHRRPGNRVPHSVVVHRSRRPSPRMGLGAGRSPHAAPRQLRDEHPAQRREESRPTRITLDELRELLPPGAVIIGGADDTRPADALRRLGARLHCEVIIIPDAGHHPGWKHQASSLRRFAPRRRDGPCETRCEVWCTEWGQIKASAVIQLEPDQAVRVGPNEAAIARPGNYLRDDGHQLACTYIPLTSMLLSGTVLTLMDEIWMREVQRDRRSFIWEHHPDRGGDPDVFIAGLNSFRPEHAPHAGPLPRVTGVRHRSWPVRLAAAAAQRVSHGPRPARVR
jgi:hypothetical protein